MTSITDRVITPRFNVFYRGISIVIDRNRSYTARIFHFEVVLELLHERVSFLNHRIIIDHTISLMTPLKYIPMNNTSNTETKNRQNPIKVLTPVGAQIQRHHIDIFLSMVFFLSRGERFSATQVKRYGSVCSRLSGRRTTDRSLLCYKMVPFTYGAVYCEKAAKCRYILAILRSVFRRHGRSKGRLKSSIVSVDQWDDLTTSIDGCIEWFSRHELWILHSFEFEIENNRRDTKITH